MIKDGPQGPGDNECTGKITISAGKRVRSSGSLQEEAGRDEGDQ